MRHTGQLICLAASVATVTAQSSRPRGVGPEFAKFYKGTETFTCISNPSIKIPLSQVNDDFCDCPDGSDEPGTSACSHLSPLSPSSPADTSIADTINSTIALPGFYCKNKGHTPSYVPFTAVNDGICDYDLCCDGSDEWSGLVKCDDRCAEIGKEARKIAEARQKAMSNATRKRKELITEALKLRKESEDKIADLKMRIAAAEIKVKATKDVLAETEKKEANRMVRGSGPLGTLVEQAKSRTGELRESLIRVRGERDALRARLQELEGVMSTFKEEYNPNFNDEGVKRAVRAWEDYAARDKGSEGEAALDRDLDEITRGDEEAGLDWEAFLATETGGDSELDLLYSFEAYLPPSLRTWVDEKLRSLRQTLIDNGILVGPSSSSSSGSHSESRALTDARTAVTTAENELRNFENDMNNHKEDLTRDYGADDVFRSLKGQCLSTDSGEYTYELCIMDRTTQKSKKGGGQTGLGNFVRFDEVDVDDGPDTVRRLAMRYENGQHCWNGPARSTLVVVACAEENVIYKISEQEKCVYRMEMGSPAACSGGVASAGTENQAPPKDEL